MLQIPSILSVLPLGLFRHGDTREVETSSTRLERLVRTTPGISVGGLLKQSGLGAGTVYYHLKRLEDKGKLQSVVIGRRRLLFPPDVGELGQRDIAGLAILRGRTTYVIAQAICRHPQQSIRDLIRSLDESPRAVYYHLKRLRDAGLVVAGSATRYRRLTPGQHLPRLLARVDENGGPSTIPDPEDSQGSPRK